MADERLTLQDLIDVLTFSNKIHISILDLSGILEEDILKIKYENRIHSSKLCRFVKTAPRGMRLCFACKVLSSKKVSKERFYVGKCPYGVTEAVKSVYTGGKPVCIIYAGNCAGDRQEFLKKSKRCAELTGGDFFEISALYDSLQHEFSNELLKKCCLAVEEFILKKTEKNFKIKGSLKTHYAVSAAVNYINEFFQSDISLRQMANLYYLNENYMGRIFKKYTGCGFCRYLNCVRIGHSKELLKNTDMNVIDISEACGFNNVTYFNRIFKKETGVTPLEYRLKI